MSEWTTPADVMRQLMMLWNRGHILSASVGGTALFPRALRLRSPDPRVLASRFDDVRAWIRMLEQGSKSTRGYGYEIVWTERVHRQLGRNRVPTGIRVESEDDALRLIGKHRDAARFRRQAERTLPRFPMLRDWLAWAPLVALEHETEWEQVLAVLQWFSEHPRSGRYLRQLDIPGVDTKFIEERRGVLTALLDLVLPKEAIDYAAVGVRQFESRYGLRVKPPLVRFRLLDPRLRLHGLSDITAPAHELAQYDPDVRRVFITENDTNGVAFPDIAESLVIFGLGYGVELLAECTWLQSKEVYYWGDIDTHGFAMLDRVRAMFPAVRSLLMDRETLLAQRGLWVDESKPCAKSLDRLTRAEAALYADLREDRLGRRVRLEQERIPFGAVMKALEEIARVDCSASQTQESSARDLSSPAASSSGTGS